MPSVLAWPLPILSVFGRFRLRTLLPTTPGFRLKWYLLPDASTKPERAKSSRASKPDWPLYCNLVSVGYTLVSTPFFPYMPRGGGTHEYRGGTPGFPWIPPYVRGGYPLITHTYSRIRGTYKYLQVPTSTPQVPPVSPQYHPKYFPKIHISSLNQNT